MQFSRLTALMQHVLGPGSVMLLYMVHLRPVTEIHLGHSASFVSQTERSLVIGGDDGRVSRLDPELTQLLTVRRQRGDLQGCAGHASDRMLALITDQGRRLEVREIGGHVLLDIRPELDRAQFVSCAFVPTGGLLCSAMTVGYEAIVERRRVRDWTVVGSTTIENEGGEGPPEVIYSRPGLGVFFLPQLEDFFGRVYWLDVRADGAPRILPEPALDQIALAIPPGFSPDGTEFLVADHSRVVHRFDFGRKVCLGSCSLERTEADYFPPVAVYLSESFAMVGTGNGRLMLLDLRSMKVVDEIAVAGHEPRPMNQYFRDMADFAELATDTWAVYQANGWIYGTYKSPDALFDAWGADRHSAWAAPLEDVRVQLGLPG